MNVPNILSSHQRRIARSTIAWSSEVRRQADAVVYQAGKMAQKEQESLLLKINSVSAPRLLTVYEWRDDWRGFRGRPGPSMYRMCCPEVG